MTAIAALSEAALARLGPRGVLTDPAELAPYSVDFWQVARGLTPLVLRPSTTEEVVACVQLAREHGVPLVPQGGNTGLVGGGVPDLSGTQAVLSLSRLNRIRAVDGAGESLIAEAGCTLRAIQDAAEGVDRLFPLSLGAEGTCQIGGNLSTNAGGINVIRYGMTRDLVLGLEVVLADGRVWQGLRTLRKDNTGYDLKQLFIGSEGSLGIITAAALRLFPRPRERATLFLAVQSPEDALALLARARGAFGELVSSFELLAEGCVEAAVQHLQGVRRPVEERGAWYCLIEVAWGLPEGLEAAADTFLEEAFEAGLVVDATRAQNEAQRAMLWRIREGQSEAMREIGPVVRSDISVPIARMPEFIARGLALLRDRHPDTRFLPFGHLGDGNLHANVVLPQGATGFLDRREAILHDLHDIVQDMGGSISAEHGIGRLKRRELEQRKPALDLELMRRLKAALDPEGRLNPGVIVGA